MQISIIICTYNRSSSLQRTLESVTRLFIGHGVKWEVLVVNNNSNDSTLEIINSFRDRLPIRFVFEPVQGLSHARNQAVRSALGDLLLFTDDDVILDPQWAKSVLEASSSHAEAGYFGGNVIPRWTNGEPSWISEVSLKELGGLVINYNLGEKNRWYEDDDPPPIGANMGFRKNILMALGPFRTDLGTIGTKRSGGEDSEMVLRARGNGWKGFYVADSICYHITDYERLSPSNVFRYGISRGTAHALMDKKKEFNGLTKAGLFLLKGAYQKIIGREGRFRLCLYHAGISIGRSSSIV